MLHKHRPGNGGCVGCHWTNVEEVQKALPITSNTTQHTNPACRLDATEYTIKGSKKESLRSHISTRFFVPRGLFRTLDATSTSRNSPQTRCKGPCRGEKKTKTKRDEHSNETNDACSVAPVNACQYGHDGRDDDESSLLNSSGIYEMSNDTRTGPRSPR